MYFCTKKDQAKMSLILSDLSGVWFSPHLFLRRQQYIQS